MDGNGRWANARGLPRTAGHEAGEASLLDVVAGRDRDRRDAPVGVRVLDRELEALARRGALPDGLQPRRDPPPPRRDARVGRAGALGRPAAPAVAQRRSPSSRSAEELTRDNDVLTLTMCVNYGGRAEIADAARGARAGRRGRPGRPAQGRREGARALPRRARPARRRPVPAVVGRAAHLELPALAVGLRRDGVPRRAVAGLRPPGCCGAAIDEYARRDRRYGGADGRRRPAQT